MKTLILVVAVLAGCRECEPLADTPIFGASVERAWGVHAVLERMDDEVVPPVCLTHVRSVERFAKDAGGRYNSATRGIRLLHEVPPDYLQRVLGHEICHAVDLQNDLVKGREELFFYEEPSELWPERRLPNEAFADTCALGRDALAAIGTAECPDVPDLRAVEAIRADVYGGEAPAPGLAFRRVASMEVGPDVYSFQVADSVEPGALLVYPADIGGRFSIELVDAWTGAPLELDAIEKGEDTRGSAGPSPPGWYPSAWGGLADGTDLFVAWLQLPTGNLDQLVQMRPDGPRTVTGLCAAEEPQFFAFEGDTWAAILGEGEIWWGRFEPLD